jgi:hypothetical protein
MALIVTKSSTPENYSFQKVSTNDVSSSAQIRLLDWLKENDLIYLQSEKVFMDSQFPKQEVVFCLTGISTDYFPLLRGIAASGHGSPFRLLVNSPLKSFTFAYDIQDEAEARIYLSKVLNLVRKEIRFKQVLRKVIYNQEKFKREEKLLFSEMNA